MKCDGLDKIILAKLLNLLFQWANFQDIFIDIMQKTMCFCTKNPQKNLFWIWKMTYTKKHKSMICLKECSWFVCFSFF